MIAMVLLLLLVPVYFLTRIWSKPGARVAVEILGAAWIFLILSTFMKEGEISGRLIPWTDWASAVAISMIPALFLRFLGWVVYQIVRFFSRSKTHKGQTPEE